MLNVLVSVAHGVCHSDAEKGVIVPYRVVRAAGAQYFREFNGGAFVVGFACYKLKRTGCIADMNIQRDEKLRRIEHIPHPEIHA